MSTFAKWGPKRASTGCDVSFELCAQVDKGTDRKTKAEARKPQSKIQTFFSRGVANNMAEATYSKNHAPRLNNFLKLEPIATPMTANTFKVCRGNLQERYIKHSLVRKRTV